MAVVSRTLFSVAKSTGAAALSAGGATTALKAAGIQAVRHGAGRMIVTKASLYVAGTLGLPGAAVAVAPVVTVVLGVATVALAVGGVVAASRGL